MNIKLQGMLASAGSVADLAITLQKLEKPSDPAQATEFLTLLSLSYSQQFAQLFDADGPVSIGWGDDPPDFVVTTSKGNTAVEVTRITTPQSEVFHRERHGSGLFTSTLRLGKPNKDFRTNLREGTLPDDSMVEPHTEPKTGLNADYKTMATGVFKDKHKDLKRYQDGFRRRILLVHDKLSMKSDFESRLPILRGIVAACGAPEFDAVLVIDGQHYSGVFAAKL